MRKLNMYETYLITRNITGTPKQMVNYSYSISLNIHPLHYMPINVQHVNSSLCATWYRNG